MTTDATVIYVAYQTPTIDLAWIPDGCEVIIVHNDDVMAPLDSSRHELLHLRPGKNLGFGAGVNLAAAQATGSRLIVCNPDTELDRQHFARLARGEPTEIVTIALVDRDGTAATSIPVYYSPATWFIGALRLANRFAPMHSRQRRLLERLRARRTQPVESAGESRYSLDTHWVSGAVFSIDRERFLAVSGFSDRFFLYYEDTDLCERLHERSPDMVAVLGDCAPGIHEVGGSAIAGASVVEKIRANSALTYAESKEGAAWKLAHRVAGRFIN